MKEIKILIDEREIVVKKIPLKKLAYLLGSLENLPSILDFAKGKTGAELLKSIPELYEKFRPDVVKIIAASTDIKEGEVDEWSLGEFIDVAEAIMTVNQLQSILSKVKKLGAQRTPNNQPSPSIPSGGSTA